MTAIIIGIVVLLIVLAMGVVVGLARKQERNHWNDNRLRRGRSRTYVPGLYGSGPSGASKLSYPSNPNYDDGANASYSIFTSSDSSFGGGGGSDSGSGCDSGSSSGGGDGGCGGGGGGD